MHNAYRITVTLDSPQRMRSTLCVRAAIDLSALDFECLGPLPRDREINSLAAHAAYEQLRERERAIAALGRELAAHITQALVEAVQSGDPQCGYSPDEWRAIHAPPKA